MKISVKVKPQAKQDQLIQKDASNYVVRVKAKAIEGKANQAVVRILSEYFAVPKSQVLLLRGQKSRNKVFNIEKKG